MTETRNPQDVQRIRELEQAFDTFNQMSEQLTQSYVELQSHVESLTGELAKMHSERLEHLKERERNRRLVAMGEMAASLAHQVRTPLAAALLYASHLTKDDLPIEARDKAIHKVLARLHHLDGVVNDMLRFARGERASLSEFEVADWLNKVHLICDPLIQQVHGTFEIENQMTAEYCIGDEDALVTVIQNLINNAIEHSGENPKVRLSLSESDQFWKIQLCDQGKGMPAEVCERIFEPFYTQRANGTGLGLAVVKSIMDAHHGTVDVESEEGQGTCFILSVPISRENLDE